MSHVIRLMLKVASFFSKSLDNGKVVRMATLTIWLAVLVRYAILLPTLPARATQYDFSLYYTSAFALRVGIDPYYSNLAPLGRILGCKLPDPFVTNYTPSFLVTFEPLTRLSVDSAYWVWFATSTGALIAALTILFAEYEISGAAMMVRSVVSAFSWRHGSFRVCAEPVCAVAGIGCDALRASSSAGQTRWTSIGPSSDVQAFSDRDGRIPTKSATMARAGLDFRHNRDRSGTAGPVFRSARPAAILQEQRARSLHTQLLQYRSICFLSRVYWHLLPSTAATYCGMRSFMGLI